MLDHGCLFATVDFLVYAHFILDSFTEINFFLFFC